MSEPREIKFRAWDKKNACFYKPIFEAWAGRLSTLFIGLSGDLSEHTMSGLTHESLFPDRFIIEQYTGLKDKNGREIYDGDIVRDSYDSMQSVIFWNPVGSWGCYEIVDPKYLMTYTVDEDDDADEIIGNIHENPELLEGD